MGNPTAQRLRELRDKFNMTQDEVASNAGISRVAYTRYESGQRMPTAKILSSLAKVFGVTSDDLLESSSFDGASPAPSAADDDDIWQLREQLRRDPERRILFDAAQKVRKEDILTAVRILDALKGGDDGDDI